MFFFIVAFCSKKISMLTASPQTNGHLPMSSISNGLTVHSSQEWTGLELRQWQFDINSEQKQVFKEKLESGGDAGSNSIKGSFKISFRDSLIEKGCPTFV